MGFHDEAAMKAIAMGRSASEFEAVSQKHANATWGFLIISVIVWYFASLTWAIVPFVLAVVTAIKSISSNLIAQRIEKLEG